MAAMACILPVVNAFPLPKKTVKPADCLFWQNWLFRVGFFLTVSGLQTARPPSDVCCRGASAWNGFNHLPGTQIPSGCFPSAPILKHHKPRPPPKRNSPARAPGDTVFAIQYAKIGGPCRGRSRRGRLGGTGLSSRGGSLQGLSQRRELTSSAGIQSRRRSGRTGRRRR